MFTNREINILESLNIPAFVVENGTVPLATGQISELPFFTFVPHGPLSVNVRRSDIRNAIMTKDSFAIETPTTFRTFKLYRFVEGNMLIVVEETTHSNKERDQIEILIYHVVHEIRNALNSVALSLDYLEEPFASSVEKSINRLDRLSQQLTDFVSMKKFEPEDVYMPEMAEYIKSQYKVEVKESAQVTWHVSRQLLLLSLRNIIENALEYAGSVSLIFNVNSIDIVDTGPGIPPEVLEKMFSPFNTTKSVGLGLFIAKKACDANGLRLDYRPNIPKGSIFTISLPSIHRI